MAHATEHKIIYHLYPFGQCAAPQNNDLSAPPTHRLDTLSPWLEHASRLGCNTLYLGPVFESSTHGYDTVDYYQVDRRLGDRKTLADLVQQAHHLGLNVVLDTVFNHVGRDFWAFKDLLINRESSAYAGWFSGLRFDTGNGQGDPFSYDTWQGHESLVKLNLANTDTRTHLLDAARQWIQDYDVDGLRLDAADCVDLGFQKELASICRKLKEGFWLLGEVVHGDYNIWANPEGLDSVTNYECYKGLYSSFNDHNFFEIAYSLNRQFGEGGIYRHLPLVAFADNHDVNRVASALNQPAHLPLLYTLLFCMPGIPALYYGSEFGVPGETGVTDWPLRPKLSLDSLQDDPPSPGLVEHISKMISLRRSSLSLQQGEYVPLHVSAEQFIFIRQNGSDRVVVAINAADTAARVMVSLPDLPDGRLIDAFQAGHYLQVRESQVVVGLNAVSSCVFFLDTTFGHS
jgi:glycosidase